MRVSAERFSAGSGKELRGNIRVSRVGLLPIEKPAGVEVTCGDGMVDVSGPKGGLGVPYDARLLDIVIDERQVRVVRKSEDKRVRALHGLIRTLVANAVKGVTEGFQRRLDVFGVGYRAEAQGQQLTLHVGFSQPVVYQVPEGIQVVLENPQGGAQARIVVSGIDKQQVGQAAADIRQTRKPEPYKGKGIRYENEVIHWKAGKTAVG